MMINRSSVEHPADFKVIKVISNMQIEPRFPSRLKLRAQRSRSQFKRKKKPA